MVTPLRETTRWLGTRARRWVPGSAGGRVAALAAGGAAAFAVFAAVGYATAPDEERLERAAPLQHADSRATIAQLTAVVAIPQRKAAGRATRRPATGPKPVTIVGEG